MFDEYVRELRRVQTLKSAEERRLWERYKRAGDRRARARLIEAYQPLVFKIVMGLRLPPAVLMDMIQEGTVGLIEAVERFEPDRGLRFSTYATHRIRGSVLNALRKERVLAGSLEAEASDAPSSALARLEDTSAEEALGAVEDAVLAERLRAEAQQLPQRERAVLQVFYFGQIRPALAARRLGVSLSHLYRLHQQALARLRRRVADAPADGPTDRGRVKGSHVAGY